MTMWDFAGQHPWVFAIAAVLIVENVCEAIASCVKKR